MKRINWFSDTIMLWILFNASDQGATTVKFTICFCIEFNLHTQDNSKTDPTGKAKTWCCSSKRQWQSSHSLWLGPKITGKGALKKSLYHSRITREKFVNRSKNHKFSDQTFPKVPDFKCIPPLLLDLYRQVFPLGAVYTIDWSLMH